MSDSLTFYFDQDKEYGITNKKTDKCLVVSGFENKQERLGFLTGTLYLYAMEYCGSLGLGEELEYEPNWDFEDELVDVCWFYDYTLEQVKEMVPGLFMICVDDFYFTTPDPESFLKGMKRVIGLFDEYATSYFPYIDETTTVDDFVKL